MKLLKPFFFSLGLCAITLDLKETFSVIKHFLVSDLRHLCEKMPMNNNVGNYIWSICNLCSTMRKVLPRQ